MAKETARRALAPRRDFSGCAVEIEEALVDCRLVGRIQANQSWADFFHDIVDGVSHADAVVAIKIAIAQLMGFSRPGAGAAGDAREADDSVVEMHVGFDGGLSPAIEDFATRMAVIIRSRIRENSLRSAFSRMRLRVWRHVQEWPKYRALKERWAQPTLRGFLHSDDVAGGLVVRQEARDDGSVRLGGADG